MLLCILLSMEFNIFKNFVHKIEFVISHDNDVHVPEKLRFDCSLILKYP